ncbi:MAG: alpha/beta family hydrolase, partial [Thermoanaerobaculia bacterium]
MASEFLFDGPAGSALTLVLAHGAGAPMDSSFMAAVARGVGERGWRAARFEFPYMRARRSSGKRGAPDREPVLRQSWLET